MKEQSDKGEKLSIRGDRIKSLRVKRGLEQGQLAYRAKVDASYIYRLEAGESPNVSAIILSRVATVLRTSTDYLVGTVDTPEPVVPQFGQPWEIIAGPLADPAVAGVAEGLQRLPAALRGQVAPLVAKLLDVLESEAVTLSERERRLLEAFDQLTPAEQAALQTYADQLLVAEHADSVLPKDAAQTL